MNVTPKYASVAILVCYHSLNSSLIFLLHQIQVVPGKEVCILNEIG